MILVLFLAPVLVIGTIETLPEDSFEKEILAFASLVVRVNQRLHHKTLTRMSIEQRIGKPVYQFLRCRFSDVLFFARIVLVIVEFSGGDLTRRKISPFDNLKMIPTENSPKAMALGLNLLRLSK